MRPVRNPLPLDMGRFNIPTFDEKALSQQHLICLGEADNKTGDAILRADFTDIFMSENTLPLKAIHKKAIAAYNLMAHTNQGNDNPFAGETRKRAAFSAGPGFVNRIAGKYLHYIMRYNNYFPSVYPIRCKTNDNQISKIMDSKIRDVIVSKYPKLACQ